MKRKELELLLNLVCDRQAELLRQKMWDSEEYRISESTKVKLKDKLKEKLKR